MEERKSPLEVIKPGIFETGMRFFTVWVDEDMARDLLLFNREPVPGKGGTNRKASKIRIALYKSRMLGGEWDLSPQPLIFTEPHDGEYGSEEQSDGQQRLKALIEACRERPGLRLPFTICIDAPITAKWLLDSGKTRQPGDYLRMDGETNSAQLSYALRLLYCVLNVRYEAPHSWRTFSLSSTAQRQFLDAHSEIRNGLKLGLDCKLVLPPYIAAVVYYLIQEEYDAFKAAEFLNGLEKGLHMSAGDARWKVREFLSRRARDEKRRDPLELYAWTLMAANAWLRKDQDWKVPAKIRNMPRLIKADELPVELD